MSDEIRDVPDVAGEWYRDVVGWAGGTPRGVQVFMEHFTELGVVLLVAVWVLVGWRARREPALLLAGGAGVVAAYGLSEWSKTLLDVERPCRTFPDLRIVAAQCPPAGDWSFPSNHSTIAAGLAVSVLLVSWRLGLVALPVAGLAAFSRVFVGVHYPHDVVVGFLIGAVVTVVVAGLLVRPVGWLWRVVSRSGRTGGPAGLPGPGYGSRGGPGSR